ncbi:MAG: DsbA family protein [Psychrobium sp.]|nr:DsbA family protein [Psychrobium sp.]
MSKNRNIGDLDILADIAVEMGLDRQRFLRDYASKDRVQEIKMGRKLAHQFGIQSTPTLVINEQWLISGALSLSELRKQLKKLEIVETTLQDSLTK